MPDAIPSRAAIHMVHVARWIDYEESGIIGVYSTAEKGREAAEADVGQYSYDLEVAEFSVDGEPGAHRWYRGDNKEWRHE